MLNMQHTQIIICPACGANRSETKGRYGVSRHAMVFIDALCIIHASIQPWSVVLREPYNSLDVEENVEGKAEARVRGREVFVPSATLVDLDDYEASSKSRGAGDVEEEVCERAGTFLLSGMGRLDDKGGLYSEEKARLHVLVGEIRIVR